MSGKKPTKKAPALKQEVTKAPNVGKKIMDDIRKDIDMENVPLGTRMRDKITGFEGIAVAKVVFLNGCVQYQLKPSKLDKDGKVYDGNTFDNQQLEVMDEGINKGKEKAEKPTGGDMPDAPSLTNGITL